MYVLYVLYAKSQKPSAGGEKRKKKEMYFVLAEQNFGETFLKYNICSLFFGRWLVGLQNTEKEYIVHNIYVICTYCSLQKFLLNEYCLWLIMDDLIMGKWAAGRKKEVPMYMLL